MSKRTPIQHRTTRPDNVPAVWRSLDEKLDPTRHDDARDLEVGVQSVGLDRQGLDDSGERSIEQGQLVDASSLTQKGATRRQFMQAAAATTAVAGLSGCIRRPAEQILPYTRAPEYSLPGIALHFATTLSHNGEALGVLVEQHEGRPTKIEGNPDHEASNPGRIAQHGGTDVAAQAAILGLYDADRSAHVMRKDGDGRSESDWSAFDTMFRERLAGITDGGRGLRVLHEPLTSPTAVRFKQAITRRFPEARFHTYASVSDSNVREGVRIATGRRARPVIDYSAARVVLALDSDFLGGDPGAVRNSRLFAAARRLTRPSDPMNRLYVAEPSLTTTGSAADHRLRLAASDVLGYARALCGALAGSLGAELNGFAADAPAGLPAPWLEAVAQDLVANRGRAVVVAGPRQPAAVHALVAMINAALQSQDTIIRYVDVVDQTEGNPLADITSLVEAMRSNSVSTLVMLGTNPAYDAPAGLGFVEALANVDTSIHLASHDDETSALATWHLPMAHELESWGDHRSIDGTYGLQQPLIAPLRGGRNAIDILGMLSGDRQWRAYQAVRQTFANVTNLAVAAQFETVWRQVLHRGVLALPTPVVALGRGTSGLNAAAITTAVTTATPTQGEWEILFAACAKAFDGRDINNPWLLELPEPITKLTWDNAAWVSPTSAAELGVRLGDRITIRQGDASLDVPVVVVPGHADRSITLPLGWGRERAGRFAAGFGTNVGPVRTIEAFDFARGASVAKGSGRSRLVVTQEHHSMQGEAVDILGMIPYQDPERPIVISGTLAEYRAQPDFTQWREPTPQVGPLWREVDYQTPQPPAQGGTSWSLWPSPRPPAENAPMRHAWGMVVDLTLCNGCSACIVACTAENNIATVGKEQIARGREMHWLRLDRYFVGDDAGNPSVVFQPVACQHCEEAPCENVCPVNATEHSPEGINEMAYNRCIGTRYCMNNCPYKVRRFNYLAYNGHPTELQRMQFNPNVSVRMRGVMEKCTYCVQRVQAARIAAHNENREIRDGDFTTACAQACPSSALTFGDLNDSSSAVHRASQIDRHYKLLAQVGTQPRTTYLGRIRNINDQMVVQGEAH